MFLYLTSGGQEKLSVSLTVWVCVGYVDEAASKRGSGHDDIVMALALAWYCAPDGAPPPPSSLLLGAQVGLGQREV